MLPRSGEPTNFINATVFGEILTGTAQNDQLRTSGTRPGSGETFMYGGLGDDTYITFSSSKDLVFENAGEGIDTVKTEWFYALPANVENLILTGTLSTSGTGNALNNVIIGNSAKNMIEGLGGADELWGGGGNDMFVLQGNDTIMDFAEGDYFDLRGFTGVTSFAQIQTMLQQVGTDTVLRLGANDVVTIKNTLVSAFSASDFLLTNTRAGYTLTFEDNFDELSLNVEHGDGGTWYPLYPRTGLAAHSTAGKSEQYFTFPGDMGSVGELVGINPFSVKDGVVTLSMNPIPQDKQYNTYGLDYSSGMLNTIGSFSQTYGYFEARIQFAAGKGIHESFWMLPIDGNGQYEFDIAEMRGVEPSNVMNVIHSIDAGRDISHAKSYTIPTATTGFHTYGVDWQPDYITFYIDGVAVRTLPTWPGLDVPMYMIASLGGGSPYAGDIDPSQPFPAEMKIDYIRAYASEYTLEKGVPFNKTGTDGADSMHGTSLGDTLNGGAGDDKIWGGAGDDILTGGGGTNDRLDGGFGDDTYFVYAASDKPTEGGGIEKGIDTVKTTLTQYTLGANLEYLVYIGDSKFSGTGNPDDNYIKGGDFGNTLSGGAGNDLLEGGKEADTLSGGVGNDIAFAGGGADSLRGNDGGDILHGDEGDDIVKGDDGDDTLYGESGFDKLYGGAGNDIMDGGAGKDYMVGGTGDDVYYVDLGSDQAVEYRDEGIDTIYTTLGTYTMPIYVENIVYTGSGTFNVVGNTSDNRIGASAGADVMTGGLGNDIYEVNNIGDVVVENADEGVDTIQTTLTTYTLGDHVENLTYTGTAKFTGNGNALANTLIGGSGIDRLDGKAGADRMEGLGGNDTYVVDSEGDVVIEAAGGGNDRVLSQVSFTLSDNVESIQLSTSKAINATGNAEANTLLGNAGVNVLDGRGGSDTLTGGGGNDLFQFRRGEANGDIVTDFAGAGTTGGDVLRLVGYGTGATIARIGNTDTYAIQAGADVGGGTETIRLTGVTTLAAGDYVFTALPYGQDGPVVEEPVGGVGTIETALDTYTLGATYANLVYTGSGKFTGNGNAFANTITGGADADRLDGKGGADVLQGGAGHDTYVVDHIGDVVVEAVGGGNDRVLSQVSYTLGANVESLQLSTSKAVDGTGNALANTLVGNAAVNVLDGRGGADTLTGGGGDDVFVFRLGEGGGDTVTDFTGVGVTGGDLLQLVGYGTGATIEQVGTSDYYAIHAAAEMGGGSELIHLTGVTNLSAGDYVFL
jgi:Ca2+-binding RTX toxin-like protein